MQNPYGYTAEQAEMLTAMMRMQQQHQQQQQQQPVAAVNSVATGFAAPPAQPLYDESLLHQQMVGTVTDYHHAHTCGITESNIANAIVSERTYSYGN